MDVDVFEDGADRLPANAGPRRPLSRHDGIRDDIAFFQIQSRVYGRPRRKARRHGEVDARPGHQVATEAIAFVPWDVQQGLDMHASSVATNRIGEVHIPDQIGTCNVTFSTSNHTDSIDMSRHDGILRYRRREG